VGWEAVAARLQAGGAEGVVPPTDDWPGHMTVLFPENLTPDEAAAQASQDDGIEAAQPDFYFSGDPQM
jgi:hypothetical protein